MFDCRQEDNDGKLDIYIAFKTTHGNWSEAISLGLQVNTQHLETCTDLSLDGNY